MKKLHTLVALCGALLLSACGAVSEPQVNVTEAPLASTEIQAIRGEEATELRARLDNEATVAAGCTRCLVLTSTCRSCRNGLQSVVRSYCINDCTGVEYYVTSTGFCQRYC